MFVSVTSEYKKMDKKHCYDDRYGRFSTIQSAKDACSNDTNCQGVYDQGCNSRANEIFLCPTSATYETSSSSCIFHKNGNGKYFKSYYFVKNT